MIAAEAQIQVVLEAARFDLEHRRSVLALSDIDIPQHWISEARTIPKEIP
jgi:hypothetical protein